MQSSDVGDVMRGFGLVPIKREGYSYDMRNGFSCPTKYVNEIAEELRKIARAKKASRRIRDAAFDLIQAARKIPENEIYKEW